MPRIGNKGTHLNQQLIYKLLEHYVYIRQPGSDMPEIRNWTWEPPHE